MTCSGVVLQVLFIPKQLMLVTSGDDSDVRVWDLVNKSCVAVLKVRTFLILECIIVGPPTNCCTWIHTDSTRMLKCLVHCLATCAYAKGCCAMVTQKRCCVLYVHTHCTLSCCTGANSMSSSSCRHEASQIQLYLLADPLACAMHLCNVYPCQCHAMWSMHSQPLSSRCPSSVRSPVHAIDSRLYTHPEQFSLFL